MNKKGIFRVLVFLVALILCDSVMGMVARMLFYSQKSGKYARLTYTVKSDTSAIVVLGSSHALAHFIPDMIQDSLHESAFNYGANGQKLLFSRALYEIRKRRSEPAMVLLNVDADWFFDKRGQEERMSDLYPYYDQAGDIILRDFSSRDRFIERLKFLSKTFPYNSTIVHVIRYKLKPQHDFNGYEPLFGAVDSAQFARELHSETRKVDPALPQPDGELMSLFTQFIGEMQKDRIRLVIVFSPELLKPDKFERAMDEKIKNICDSTGTTVLDFSTSDFFKITGSCFTIFLISMIPAPGSLRECSLTASG
ncbi:MAG TPA: hypothetical protein VKU83_00185 [Puia sp.]|nr:hypothetical protein [Puia sp.]